MVAPAIHVAGGVNVHIDPAITSEFANVVYRFGHSMLDENLNVYQMDANGRPIMDPVYKVNAAGHYVDAAGNDLLIGPKSDPTSPAPANAIVVGQQPRFTAEGLIDAFTDPVGFANALNAPGQPSNGQVAGNMPADLIMGMVNQVGNEIDEFVTGTLENNLDGAPLDLAALNIARGRDTGVMPLNLVRAQLFSISGEAQLKPYTSWADFGSELKHFESLANFIAAYGTYSTIVNATTNAAKVAAAQLLVAEGMTFNPAFVDQYNFMHSQGAWANNVNDPRAFHDSTGASSKWSSGSVTGLDQVDMWIGGLAEKQNLFGGVLGSTFEYVFRTQMEALQDADRLYYLPRIEGMDYEGRCRTARSRSWSVRTPATSIRR